ncbi:hypothetical protein [Caballeronia sp. INDeC2]|uniref:hypothetical protein n=1 Tax=Caballeronia sp. INDeC2 TaxID=2921747 RepID=UPI002028CEEE|nr:hypothetical protein [Caballeronia sp. INDeC2]
MAVTRFAAVNGRPSGTRFDAEPAYEIRAEGDACFSSTARAQECGASMGKVLGEALRAAPVLHIDAGA